MPRNRKMKIKNLRSIQLKNHTSGGKSTNEKLLRNMEPFPLVYYNTAKA